MRSHRTGRTHISIGLGLAACGSGLRLRFFTAADWTIDSGWNKKIIHTRSLLVFLELYYLLIGDELGYVTMRRGGVDLLFRVVADRHERGNILVTSNLPFSQWNQILRGERMTAALLDRLAHYSQIFEMNGELPFPRADEKNKYKISSDDLLTLLPRAAILKTEVG
ncbi:ATP-binding protein [Singulisphaera rosea]